MFEKTNEYKEAYNNLLQVIFEETGEKTIQGLKKSKKYRDVIIHEENKIEIELWNLNNEKNGEKYVEKEECSIKDRYRFKLIKTNKLPKKLSEEEAEEIRFKKELELYRRKVAVIRISEAVSQWHK